MPSSVVLLCWLLCCCCCVPRIPAPAATVVDPCTADARALRTGALTSVKCLFAHLPAHLSTLASKFASEGFASAHDILEAQLDDEDLRGLGVRGTADQQVFRRALGSLLQPPLPPAPPRLSPSSTAVPSAEARAVTAALIRAVKESDVVGVAAALEQGADPNMMLSLGGAGGSTTKWSALRWAAYGEGGDDTTSTTKSAARRRKEKQKRGEERAQLEILRLLLRAGADPNLPDAAGQVALHTASYMGHAEVVRALLEHGARADVLGAQDSLSALHWVAIRNHTEGALAQLLVEGGGAKVDQATREGMTALMLAADRQHTELCAVLLQLGADPNSALTAEIIKPNLHVSKGATPLMLAVAPSDGGRGDAGGPKLATLEVLLRGGARPTQPDAEGMTVHERSRCKEGSGWLSSVGAEAQREFEEICRRLQRHKDTEKEAAMHSTEVGRWLASQPPVGSRSSYARLFYEKGVRALPQLTKRFRNEMDLLDFGVRKKKAAVGIMQAIRELDPGRYDELNDAATAGKEDTPKLDWSRFPSLDVAKLKGKHNKRKGMQKLQPRKMMGSKQEL